MAFGVYRTTGATPTWRGRRRQGTAGPDRAHGIPDARITLIDDATTYTAASYHSAMETLYEGAALAVIVVFLFLRNWRATLIAAVALPCRSSRPSS